MEDEMTSFHTQGKISEIVHTFFLNILSIYICILRFLFYLIELLVYKYIYLIYLKKSMNDFRNFSLCKNII